VYLLQKLSEQEIYTLHEKLISRLEKSIVEQKAGEFEWYGLEFIATHLIIHSILNSSKLNPDEYKNNCDRLSEFCVDKELLRRQVEISNGILWSRESIFLTFTFFQHIQEPIPFDFFENLIDLHKEEEYRVIRLLNSVNPENYLHIFYVFKNSLDNRAIDFQLAVIFYYLIIKDVLDAVFEDKGKLLEFFTNEFKNYLFSNNKDVFEVIPSFALINLIIDCNKYVNNCFEDFFLKGYCFIGLEFIEDIRKIEINIHNLHNHIQIFDSLISFFKKNGDFQEDALQILRFKIYTLLNFDKLIEAKEFIVFEKKQGYFETEDILEVEKTITAFKSNYPSIDTLTLGFDYELSDFERFYFYTWIIDVIDELEKNDLVKAMNLMNQIYFDFEEINALLEFLWYCNQIKNLKFIILNAKGIKDNKWDSSCVSFTFEDKPAAYYSEVINKTTKDVQSQNEKDFKTELSFYYNLDCTILQREEIIKKLINKSFGFNTNIRAITNSFISLMHHKNGDFIKSNEYLHRTIAFFNENKGKPNTYEIQKFIAFNLIERNKFELAINYIRTFDEKDIGFQSKFLFNRISKFHDFDEILKWAKFLISVTENPLLIDEIMTVFSSLGKNEIAEDLINKFSNSKTKFYALLKLAELNTINTHYTEKIESCILDIYEYCLNKEVLVRLIKLGLIDFVRKVYNYDWETEKLKTELLYELMEYLADSTFLSDFVIKFKDNSEYVQSITTGFVNNVKYPNLDSSILSVLILLNKQSFEVCYKLEIMFLVNEYFQDKIDLISFEKLNQKYNLQWAIDIKNQLPS
jgi:hypothetical protein